jgi:hypothetical protein
MLPLQATKNSRREDEIATLELAQPAQPFRPRYALQLLALLIVAIDRTVRCSRCRGSVRPAKPKSATMAKPQVGRVYRCHVCRLELTLDADRNKLTLVPLPVEKSRRLTEPKR